MPNPNVKGEFILWKQYGFCHILRDSGSTYCGNKVAWLIQQYKSWGGSFLTKIKYGKDAQKRPLCGTCRRLSEAATERTLNA